jgi:glycolate oxidase
MSSPSRVSPAPDPVPVPAPPTVIARLAAVVGPANVIHEAVDLRTYECDALTSFRASPSVVVLPGSTEEVAKVVRIAVDAGMPVVPRGAGTGLSGGALPVPGCVLLGLSRMKRILEVNLDDGWIRVQPGVINLDVSKEISAAGYYYAPDPSSQSVCTIGGNVAENSGGAHCLKYGFTVNHVLGARLVTADGAVVDLGPARDPGPTCWGGGAELGITEVTLRILRKARPRTFFATFPSTTEGGALVSEIISSDSSPRRSR